MDIKQILEWYTKVELEPVSSEDLEVDDLFFLKGTEFSKRPKNKISLNVVLEKRKTNFVAYKTLLGMQVSDGPSGQYLTIEEIQGEEQGLRRTQDKHVYDSSFTTGCAYRIPKIVLPVISKTATKK